MNPTPWPTASELRQQLQSEPSESRSLCLEQLRWLGRYGLEEELDGEMRRLRFSPQWDALLALEVSRAWLLAGRAHKADLAFLEADRLDPALALVPDVWGLWPAPPPHEGRIPKEQRDALKELATQIRSWRVLKPRSLESSWRQHAEADWTKALTGSGLDELVLLFRFGGAHEQPIESFLAALVGEDAIAENAHQAMQFWAVMTEIRPEWVHARIKATDLALARGDRERCATWIATATTETRRSAWYWDIAARHAVETGEIASALDHWGQALATAPPELAEVFRQRRREARRGEGVLQARSQLNRGDTPAALDLLQRLVADDPQWEPLRSLLHQAEAASDQLSPGFAGVLDRAAARIGLALPPASPPADSVDNDLEVFRQSLDKFSRTLSEAEARFALET